MTGDARASALVDVDELRELVSGGDAVRPLLLDVRWTLAGADLAAYRAAHIPGAVFCDLDTDLAGPAGEGGRHPLPDPGALTDTLRRLGVSPDREVVAYDAATSLAASRAWWCLRWAGHHRVRVLDGGFAAWVRAGLPTQDGDVAPVPAPEAVAVPGGMPVRDVDEVAAGATSQVLLDARAAERFRGEVEPIDPVAGHIPGATSCPVTGLLRDDGRFLPRDELELALREVLDTQPRAEGGSSVVAYCGSGITAAQLVLALGEVGVEAALYPGSWSQWVRNPSRPVATGP